MIYGRSGGRISTTRIREGTMDVEGNTCEPDGLGASGSHA